MDKKEAREEGRLLGQEEGKFLLLKNQIQKKLQKGLSPEEIAKALEKELSTILALIKEL
ncbi:MAG: hypothetical protein UDA99_08790 [Blautia hydrogenotrophica]|nr:hypothetical protein [Blautia hydrogenotrophica]